MIRYPLTSAFSKNVTSTIFASQVFNIPFYDVGGVVCKFITNSIVGPDAQLDVIIQTTDDGGTTWYDSVHFAQQNSASVVTLSPTANALWATIPNIVAVGTYIGNAGAGTVIAKHVGLPILSPALRLRAVGSFASSDTTQWSITVYANDQVGSGD